MSNKDSLSIIRDKLEKLRESAREQEYNEFAARHFDGYVKQSREDADKAGAACCALAIEIEGMFEHLLTGLNLYRATVPAYVLPSLEKQQRAAFEWERNHGKDYK